MTITPDDLRCANLLTENGWITSDHELLAHLQFVMGIMEELVKGRTVTEVYATPEGTPATDGKMDRLNVEFVFDSGWRLIVQGDWVLRVCECPPVGVVADDKA